MKPATTTCRLLAAAAALFGAVHAPAAANESTRTIWFTLLDEPTGEPTPAMICIRNLDDNTVRLPPDGRILDQVSRTGVFFRGIDYRPEDPAWIGPVRKTQGKGDNDDRAWVYEQRPSIPYWRETVMMQAQPSFSIDLELGRYRISVARGMEVIPVERAFSVGDGHPREHRIGLKRWVNLGEAGWHSGDVHVHHPTREENHRAFLLAYARAEDLHLVNVLEMGHHQGTDFKQEGFGKDFRRHQDGYWLVSGQEEPRSTFGHIIGLNTRSLARDLETYDLYDLAFQRIHAQAEALVGFAHLAWNGCDLPRGFPWYVTTEAIDFVELMQFNTINTLDYYEYLNLGFRLAAAAGSDTPWGSTIGEVRTYVYTGDQTLDPDAWFEGLRRGHSFVSNGPALTFTVNGALPGSELQLREAGDVLTIRIRAWGHERVGRPEILNLVSNEGIVRGIQRSPEQTGPLELDVVIPIQESRWLAASTRCPNGAVAHTTPVYVVVDGRPTWSRTESPRIVGKQLEAIAGIEAEVAGGTDARSRAIRERLARARDYYAKLLRAVDGP